MIKGEPWWVLADVCEALGIANSRNVSDRLEEDEKNTVRLADGIPGNPNKTIISESGLYSVILRSDKPEAKRFRHWVTSEVLPSIRKTGRYSLTAEARRESAAARNALTRQWQDHGASAPYHFINLTRTEYETIFGDRKKRKEDMTEEERAVLMVFESVEHLKLIKNSEISGYHELNDSLKKTAQQLPLFTVACIGATA
jgi:prophage antirepressor-like protein